MHVLLFPSEGNGMEGRIADIFVNAISVLSPYDCMLCLFDTFLGSLLTLIPLLCRLALNWIDC